MQQTHTTAANHLNILNFGYATLPGSDIVCFAAAHSTEVTVPEQVIFALCASPLILRHDFIQLCKVQCQAKLKNNQVCCPAYTQM